MIRIITIFLTVAVLLFSRIEALFFNFDQIFGNATVKDHQVYWNVPTFMCHKYGMQFEEVSRNFGILQNQRDEFRGDQMAILYDPGMFPALLKSSNGSLVIRNGGVPQQGNLTKHLEVFTEHLAEQITDVNFNGLGTINFESWRPIFRQNWASLAPYRDLSIRIETEKHPFWSKKSQKNEAIRNFEKAGRAFMEETLKAAIALRPQAMWGYYAYPFCYNPLPDQPPSRCDPKVLDENDKMSWLFKTQGVLLPSLYLRKTLTNTETKGLINGRLKESLRMSKKSVPRIKVLPYFWYKYQDHHDIFLSREDVINGLNAIMDGGANGYVIWGSSNDFSSREKCQKFRDYLSNILGPAVVGSRKLKKQNTNYFNEETNPVEDNETHFNANLKKNRRLPVDIA